MDTARLLKSKVSFVFWLFSFLLLLCVVNRLQGIDRTAGTITMRVNISTSALLFYYFLDLFFFPLSRYFFNATPTPFCSENLCHKKNYLKHDTHIIEVGQKDGMKSRIKPVFKCNSNIWMCVIFFLYGFQCDGPARCRLKLGFINGFICVCF